MALRPRDVAVAMDILGDLFAAPTFRDIELERPIILEEILEDLDDRGRNVNIHDISRAAAWQGHPLGFPVIGPARNVRRFATSDVRRHFRQLYGARNMALCVAGRVKREQVRALAARAFAKVPVGPAGRAAGGARRQLDGPRIRFVTDEGSQVQVQLVFHALAESDPPFPALATLMRLLDDGMSTPLHYRVCDQKGLAYHVSAGHRAAARRRPGRGGRRLLAREPGRRWCRRSWPSCASCRPCRWPRPSWRRPSAATWATWRPGFDDLDGLCGWFGGTELFFRPYSHVERARRVQRVTAARRDDRWPVGCSSPAPDRGHGRPGQGHGCPAAVPGRC